VTEEVPKGETARFDAPAPSAGEEPAPQPAAEESATSQPEQDAPPVYDRPVRGAEDDYTDARRREEIAGTLKAMSASLALRTAIVGVLALNALYFGLAAVSPALPRPTGLAAPGNEGVFALVVWLVSLLLAGAVSWPVCRAWSGCFPATGASAFRCFICRWASARDASGSWS
jgi:hypothetical protein